MSKAFGNVSIDIPCPKCGYRITQPVSRLELNPQLTCPRCHVVFDVDATEFRQTLRDADKKLEALMRRLKKL